MNFNTRSMTWQFHVIINSTRRWVHDARGYWSSNLRQRTAPRASKTVETLLVLVSLQLERKVSNSERIQQYFYVGAFFLWICLTNRCNRLNDNDNFSIRKVFIKHTVCAAGDETLQKSVAKLPAVSFLFSSFSCSSSSFDRSQFDTWARKADQETVHSSVNTRSSPLWWAPQKK